ncbi:Ig-like domain-containing protein [Candidatus Solirubrobacter pratensis]|uniref:hypothetical protein n=1 Tax=Candidatus Solirubrobacter pratensis TaxID=1298857 RepID=UPI00040F64C5|nr:hypothetical protein [Candidatus Solirubrobacter pratensis]
MIAQLAAAIAILAGPSGLTNDPTPTFAVSGDGALQCRVDDAAWQACADEFTAPELTDGGHLFRVRDASGASAFRSFTVDTVAPQVTIDGADDAKVDATTASVTFSSPEPGVELRCAQDSGEPQPCTSPWSTPDLPNGQYSVVVRATDGAGNTGTATRLVKLAASPPETSLDGPEGAIKERSPTYAVSSSRARSTFQCKIDDGEWATCGEAYTTPALEPGAHTIQARATDAGGNVDPTPAGRDVEVRDCTSKLEIGAVTAIADCFVKQDGKYVSDNGTMKVNGITFNAYKGQQLAIDVAKRKLVFGRTQLRIGGIVLYKGGLNWSIPEGDRVTLANLNLSTFSKEDEKPADSEAALDLEGDDGADVQGFPLTGTAKLELAKGGKTILTGTVELPKLLSDAEGHGLTGTVTLTADNDRGIQLGGITVKAPLAFVGKVEVHNFFATYNGERNNDAKPSCNQGSPGLKWDGGAEKIVLPTPDKLTITQVGLGFADRGFNYAKGVLTAAGEGVSIGAGIKVQKIDIAVCAGPPAKVEGRIALTALPGDKGPGLKIPNAGVLYEEGEKATDPWTLKVLAPEAELNVGKPLKFTNVRVGYSSSGTVDFGGRVNFSLGLKGPVPGGDLDAAVTVDAGVDGWFTSDRFNADFDATGCFAGKFTVADTLPISFSDICPKVKGVVSTYGMAICGGLAFKGKDLGYVGAGYKWGDDLKVFAGACDLKPWRAVASASAVGERVVRVEGGQRAVLVSARGIGHAPKVGLRGPGGRGDSLTWTNDALDTTYVLLVHPRGGRWTVTGEPVVELKTAGMRPAPKVSARLRGKRLSYRVAAVKGQRVTFEERGRGVSRSIATATRSGSVTFTPSRGPGGRRRIVALVEQDGLPRKRITVATFKARGAARPGTPRGVKVEVRALGGAKTRAGAARAGIAAAAKGATITWRPAKGAARYGVRVALEDGRRLFFLRDADDRVVRVPDARGVVAVRVVGLRADNVAGPAAITSGRNR